MTSLAGAKAPRTSNKNHRKDPQRQRGKNLNTVNDRFTAPGAF